MNHIGIEDPVAIREGLAKLRRFRMPFEQAWVQVVGLRSNGEMHDFMRKHFRAAYNNTPAQLGRFGAPDAEPGRRVLPRVPVESATRPERCKSSDPCKAAAGHGRFGSFCAKHAAELAAVDVTAPEYNSSGGGDEWREAA